jgi:hypothetical protein
MTKVVSLCPSCTACPAVEIGDREIRIGEESNTVRLTPAEWNVLVRAVRAGDLDEVATEEK